VATQPRDRLEALSLLLHTLVCHCEGGSPTAATERTFSPFDKLRAPSGVERLGCFVAALLAMTIKKRAHCLFSPTSLRLVWLSPATITPEAGACRESLPDCIGRVGTLRIYLNISHG
jgi:hypothetical protein